MSAEACCDGHHYLGCTDDPPLSICCWRCPINPSASPEALRATLHDLTAGADERRAASPGVPDDLDELRARATRNPDPVAWRTGEIPVARLEAMIRLLGDGEITPTAKRLLRKLCDEHRA